MMPSIVLVGLDFHTAAIEIREKLALSGCALEAALQHLRREDVDCEDRRIEAQEAVILSTCNRLEFYLVARDPDEGRRAVLAYMGECHGIARQRLAGHLYCLTGAEAVTHLLRVAGGLESMILGEPQILGQVGKAYAEAHAAGTTGPVLSHLFARARHCGKRARSETAIASHTVSLSHAAADLVVAGDERSPWRHGRTPAATGRVLIVGAGEMAELAAQALQSHGVSELVYVNRTVAAAQRLVERFGGEARPWTDLSAELQKATAVISATGAPHIVITRDHVATALKGRENAPLRLVDLALPRDIDPLVAGLPGVSYYDLDRLNASLDENRTQRRAATPLVEAIVTQEGEAFARWLRARQAVPTVVQLKSRARRLADLEAARTLRKLGSDDPSVARELELLTHRLVNKLLHEPTVRLKKLAESGDGILARQAVQELFGLDTDQ